MVFFSNICTTTWTAFILLYHKEKRDKDKKGGEEMMIIKIKKINVWSLARMLVFLFFILTFIDGIIKSVQVLIDPALLSTFLFTSNGQALLSFLVIGPLIIAVVGFFIGLIGGLFYNIIAMWLGGISLDVEEHKRK